MKGVVYGGFVYQTMEVGYRVPFKESSEMGRVGAEESLSGVVLSGKG